MTKAELMKRLEKLVEASQVANYNTEIKINEWNNYGKSRTYFSIVRTCDYSKHYEKLDCGYFDNQSEIYVASRTRDLSEDSVYDFGGNNLVVLEEKEEVVETVEETAEVVTVKYNKSQIFKNAWKLVKETAITISEALRKAWTEAKEYVATIEAEATEQFRVVVNNFCTNEIIIGLASALNKVNSLISSGFEKSNIFMYKWSTKNKGWAVFNKNDFLR